MTDTMPKKIRFESAVHQFFCAADHFRSRLAADSPSDAEDFARWVKTLVVDYPSSRFRVSWAFPEEGEAFVPLETVQFYVRGDSRRQDFATPPEPREAVAMGSGDPIEAANSAFFDSQVERIVAQSGLLASRRNSCERDAAISVQTTADRKRKEAESFFHDEWASEVDIQRIDVRRMNEACTAPEMRFIRSTLGELSGRTLLDVGCGLGEASVYFAIGGADVTASDISPGMLQATERLAQANGVKVKTLLTASEELAVKVQSQFDIIYVGNALHHVDITATLDRLVPLLKNDGIFISWDPLAYNPIINVYRLIATRVRTKDEHPLRVADLQQIRSYFHASYERYFWLTTLAVFICMALVQRRNPNKERFWKKVVEEADDWAWLYRPLERLDRALLCAFPFAGILCWNVVFVGKNPKPPSRGKSGNDQPAAALSGKQS